MAASLIDSLGTIISGAARSCDTFFYIQTSPNGDAAISEGRHAIILNVFTEPEWRRRCVAALLIQDIIAWSCEQRLDRLVLNASAEGRALYECLGLIATNELKFAGDNAGRWEQRKPL